MTKILPHMILAFSLWSLCSSCSHQYYAPSDAMLLGLDEQGAIRAGGAIGTNYGEGEQRFNTYLAAGYSPFKHVGLMANYFYLKNKSNGTAFGKGFSSEIAVGLYKTLSQSSTLYPSTVENISIKQVPRKRLIGDVYAGYGYGIVNNKYAEGGHSKLSFNKYFIQSALHIKYKKLMTTSLGLKFVRLDYQKGLLLGEAAEDEVNSIRRISRQNPYSFCELLAKMEIGPPRTKFFWQVTITTKFDDKAPLDYVPFVFSTGATFDF